MANNPFYPGYIPGSDREQNFQPFYPGYFPGRASPRPPKKFANIKPSEFNFDEVYATINMLEANYELAGPGMPRWMIERAMDDFQQSLKATIKPDDVSVTELDDYDPSVLPGAFGINLNLNPIDWYEDPKKQLNKTLTGWAKAGLNWQDMETRFRQDAWKQLMNPEPTAGAGAAANTFKFGWSEAFAVQAMGAYVGAYSDDDRDYRRTKNPLRLMGRNVYEEKKVGKDYTIDMGSAEVVPLVQNNQVVKDADGNVKYTLKAKTIVEDKIEKTDMYAAAAAAIVEFETKSGFGPKREGAYDSALNKTLHAVRAEMQQDSVARSLIGSGPSGALSGGSGAPDARFSAMPGAGIVPPPADDFALAFKAFDSRLQVLDAMEAISTKAGDFEKHLSAEMVKKGGKVDINSAAYFVKTVEENVEQIRKIQSDLAATKGAEAEAKLLEKYTTSYTKQAEGMLTRVSMAKVTELGKQKIALDAKKAADIAALKAKKLKGTDYQDAMDKIHTAYNAQVETLQTQLSVLSSRAVLRDLHTSKSGGIVGKGLIGRNLAVASEYSLLLRDTALDLESPGFRKGTTIGHLVAKVNETNKDTGAQASRAYLKALRMEVEPLRWVEIGDAIESNSFMEKVVWERVKNYIKGTTPAELMTEQLKKVNYFGLMIDRENDKSFEKSTLNNLANAFTGNKGTAPNALFGNYFSVQIQVGGKIIYAKVYGGDHFQAIEKLQKLAASGEWGADAVAHLTQIKSLKDLDKNSVFFKELKQKVTDHQKSLGKKGVKKVMGAGLGDAQSVEEFAIELIALRKWLEANKDRFPGADINDPAFIQGFVKALSDKNGHFDFKKVGILRKHAGLLEKVFVNLNALQTKILANRFVAKYIAPIAYAKEAGIKAATAAVTKAITTLMSKLLILAAGAATSGIGAAAIKLLEKPIRIIVNLTIRKVTEVAGVVYSGIVKGDYDSMMKYADKQVQAGGKVMLILAGGFYMLFALPGQKFLELSAVSFSPVDATKVAGIAELFEPAVALGSGIEIIPTESKPSTASPCFEFVDATSGMMGADGTPYTINAWASHAKEMLDGTAIPMLMERGGGYVDRLCEKGPIKLFWTDSKPNWCGHVYPDGGIFGGDAIVFSNTCSYNPALGYYYGYFFSHETAHVYQNRIGWDHAPDDNGLEITWESVDDYDHGTLPTYPITWSGGKRCSTSNSSSEDFAETLGNWVRINTKDCSGIDESLWSRFPRHYLYADKVLTRPYGGTTTPALPAPPAAQ